MAPEDSIKEYDGRQYRAVSVTDVGEGDYLKNADGGLVRIVASTCPRGGPLPRKWEITGEDGRTYTMWDVALYLQPVREE